VRLTIFTNSIPVASKLCEYPNIDGVLLGGNILRKGYSIIGHQAIESLKEVNADMCFLGITSVDIVAGMTEANRSETTIKKAMINSSAKVVSMVISNKINTRQPFKVCDITCMDVMVTDLDPDDELLLPYRQRGVKIL
jgi:DeoR/GlpR family transcriptional regulator of sugar metabolism